MTLKSRNRHVALVAFAEYDNLGAGYLSAVLSASGFSVTLIDFRRTRAQILSLLRDIDPVLVGFSVIFQYHIGEFAGLIRYLRRNGINCHFTAGGHYASLRYAELFAIIPALDSIVRFEGENTLLQLVMAICGGSDWKRLKGLAFMENGRLTVNPLRPTEKDLDKFPFPLRAPLREYALGKKEALILAGRGCKQNCSFCNIHEYYHQAAGPVKRIRRPEFVASEIESVLENEGGEVFLFQDDDFPVKEDGTDWVKLFCRDLKRRKLAGKILWKINCRPDEIRFRSFKMMSSHGLFLVFLGIEDGTDEGLARLNKRMRLADCLKGIGILKKLGIGFDYGFMLFQPSSTFASIRENLEFLRVICGDGYTPVSFLKMLPYFETRIEKELKASRRLKGKPGFLDYDFNQETLGMYYDFTNECFGEWLRNPEGLHNLSKWARNYALVGRNFMGSDDELNAILSDIRNITSASNNFLIDTMVSLLTEFDRSIVDQIDRNHLISIKNDVKRKHTYFSRLMHRSASELIYIADNDDSYSHYP